MKPIAPSRSQCVVLRRIAGAGFESPATKRLCAGAGWALVTDEPESGFLQFSLPLDSSRDETRLLNIGTQDVDGTPHLFLPLFFFPEENRDLADEEDRRPFDDAFRRLTEELCSNLGPSSQRGAYEHPHHTGWQYHYCTWRVTEAQVLLLQDEHDIQFGRDISLWFFPADRDVSLPLPY